MQNTKTCEKCFESKCPRVDFYQTSSNRPAGICKLCYRVSQLVRKSNCTEDEAREQIAKSMEATRLRKELSDSGLKRCIVCQLTKPVENFPGTKKLKVACRDCMKHYNYAAYKRMWEKDWLRVRFNTIKGRAKRFDIPFDLDEPYLRDLLELQNNACVLTGLVFETEDIGTRKHHLPFSPSLDRIVPDKGYTKGNVRWVVHAINMAMSNWGLDVFDTLARSYLKVLEFKGEAAC